MASEFSKPFWEEIKVQELKDGDVIYIDYVGTPSYDHFRIINGKWFNVFQDRFIDYFKPDDKVAYRIFRQNYKFISKPNQWFQEGTEVFLESEPWGNEKNGYSAVFRGWHKDEITGKIVEDGEACPFDEFEIRKL